MKSPSGLRSATLRTVAQRQPDTGAWAEWVGSTVQDLEERCLLRTLRPMDPARDSATRVHLADHAGPVVVFAANDYLGLSSHPEVRAAASAAALAYGSGPRGSALLCGYTGAHRALEEELAALKGCDEALLFPTGFAANLSVMGTFLTSSDCALFSDELNHASIVDGARLAVKSTGASLHIYRHNDLQHLESLLSASRAPRKLIVSDSIFSMDGDCADVVGLAGLRKRYGALLCLDEAHATLVYGARGGGLAEASGLCDAVDLHVGTLSKAFGSHGGFVGCSAQMKSLLLSKGRAGIYSTALPLPAVAAASAALRAATAERRNRLWTNVAAFASASALPATSPIVPLIVGSAERALDAARELLGRGYLVPAVRPPTVPAGSARLRLAFSAAHEEGEVRALVSAMRDLGLV